MSVAVKLGGSVGLRVPSASYTMVAPVAAGRPGPPGADGAQGPQGPPGSSLSTRDGARSDLFRANSSGWAGGDVASNMRTADGRDLFVWGDTMFGAVDAEGAWVGTPAMHRRSLSVIDPATGEWTTWDENSALLAPLKTTPGTGVVAGEWMWFGGLAPNPAGTRAFAFCQGMEPTETGEPGWNYRESRRTALAEFDVTDTDSPTLVRWDEWVRTDNETGIIWGDAAWLDDGYVYVTGRTSAGFLQSWAYLSRVPASNVWGTREHWDGTGWSTTPGTEATISGDAPFAASGYRRINGVWFGLCAPFYGAALEVWSAAEVTGPWGKVADAWYYPDTDDVFYYSPRWVPQWDDPTGLAVIIPHNSKAEPFEPWEYQPTVVRLSRLLTITDVGVDDGSVAWTDVTGKPVAYPPTGHEHTTAQVTDMTAVGKAVAVAADQAAGRAAIGAGTSNLAIGTTAATAAAGNHGHNASTALTTGTVPTARLGSGTANSTTYLAGDQTWKTTPPTYSSGGAQGTWTAPATDGLGSSAQSNRLRADWRGGWCQVHVDCRQGVAGSSGVVIATLPASVPTPAAIAEVAAAPGVNFWIDAGTRNISAAGAATATTRYIVNIMYPVP